MKLSRCILISAAICVLCVTAACSRGGRADEMNEEDGRRRVFSGKDDIEETTPPTEEATYVMRLENKTLTLYECTAGEETALKSVNIDPDYYPPEDIKELTLGISARSMEDGYIRMENFTN